MTVAALPATKSYVENGVTVNFAVPFRFKAASDLIVERIVGGVVATLALGIDYTVTGGETDAGGSITRTAATTGATLRIRRRTARSQAMDYATGDRFPAESHEGALDRAMLIDQEQDALIDDVTGRSILMPPGETGWQIPGPLQRAGKFLAFLANGVATLLDTSSIAKGDPGGNAMAVGAFIAVAALNIPVGTDRIVTSGHVARDEGAAQYSYDPTVDAAFVAAHPGAAVMTANGRGFRLASGQTLFPSMFGAANDDTRFARARSWMDFSGQNVQFLDRVAVATPRIGWYPVPAGVANPLKLTRVFFNGIGWRFEKEPYAVAVAFTIVTEYWLDYKNGSNANNGTSSGTPVKTLGKIRQLAKAAADKRIRVHCKDARIGRRSYTDPTTGQQEGDWDGLQIEFVGENANGLRTRFSCLDDDIVLATFAWSTHGANGAVKSTVGGAAIDYASMLDALVPDAIGLPSPMVRVASAALVAVTPNSYFFDSGTGTLYVFRIGGRIPDPDNGWIVNDGSPALYPQQDSGTLAFRGWAFSSQDLARGPAFRFRWLATSTGCTSTLAFKDCEFYGASGNALGAFGNAIGVLQDCRMGYCGQDGANYHQRPDYLEMGTGKVWYEQNVRITNMGYAGWKDGTPGGSENASTCHDGYTVIRADLVAADCAGGVIVDVLGCESVNFGVLADQPNQTTGGGGFYPAAFVYACDTGQGTSGRRNMWLFGCGAQHRPDQWTLQVDGTATDARIIVDNWRGPTAPRLKGVVHAYNDNGVYNAASLLMVG